VYKQAFYLKDKDLISFQEEIDGLNLYLTMLRSRFSEGLIVMMDLAPVEPITKYRIPAMSLQILVENCIKHNIATLESPLHIRISQETATSVTVSNNLQRILYHQDSANIGHQYLETQYQAAGIQNGMRKEVNAREYAVTLILL
jgi:LytS/YehU family sensor histidine kinase